MATWGLARRLFAVDVLTMAFVTAVGAGTLAVLPRVPAWPEVVVACALIAAGIPFAAWLRTHLDLAAVRFVHDWALAIVLVFIYRSVVLVAGPAHSGRTIDAWLISADRWLCGTDPTVWLQPFAFPALTEVLQIAYASFYAIPIVVGAELYARRSDALYRQWVFVCGLGFFLSYAGYLALPAIGPRFTLHDITALDRELPGLWLTSALRAAINEGGLVPGGVTNAIAAAGTARDAFPSGHAMMTLVAMWWSWRHRLRLRRALSVIGVLLILATVYLRYHYVVDVLAGALLAVAVVSMGPGIHRWLAEHLGTADADHTPAFRLR